MVAGEVSGDPVLVLGHRTAVLRGDAHEADRGVDVAAPGFGLAGQAVAVEEARPLGWVLGDQLRAWLYVFSLGGHIL